MILRILKTLESDNSRLFKEKILNDNKDNPLLQRVLKSALDTHTQYYQRKIPAYEATDRNETLPWALDQLKPLTEREVTGNKAIDHLSHVLGSINTHDAEVVKRIIEKDLKCGVSISTVNKIFGKGFISTYPCMLASPMSSMKNVTYPALVQTKMDGMRANIIIDAEGNVDVRSRNGKQIYLTEHFQTYVMGIFHKSATLENLDNFHGAVLDGELIVLSEGGNEILDRKTGNGILNKAVKGTITPEEASRVRMWCWDMIPLKDFWKGICTIPYFDRVSVLTERMNTVYNAQDEHLINVLSATPVDNQEQAEQIFQIALGEGEEGIIIKNGDSPWEDKRSKFQVKMKAELEIDLLVTDVIEGKGKAEGLIGSLSCKSKCGTLLVNVGSGLNDEDRNRDPKEFIGKIVSVKYNEKIKDKKSDTFSLFLPIFQELRLDKSEADNL
tara:strand:- start:2044 stop:3369 length:1326 start_codon:yes stop_codon:yes gene_type:complete